MADPSSSIFANDGVASDAGIRIKSPFDTSIFSVDKGIRASHPAVRRFHEITLPAARAIVHAAFARYKPMNVAVAFNGGKDCTVLVDLVMEALRESKSCLETSLEIRVIYIRSHLQFGELEDFIEEKIRSLGLSLSIYEGSTKESLIKFKADYPATEGIFMGTRCKDPSSMHLDSFSPTDPGWPTFMRILPILNFSFHDVWLYLKEFDVNYCRLYDEGYTSVGWEGNTFRNPKLRTVDDHGVVIYKPAYMLEDSDDERTSRD